MYFLSKYNLNIMVNRKLSRKKIVSKSSKIKTKKVGGGLKGTKKSLSRGVNSVLAGLRISSKARARRNIREKYEQSKGKNINLGRTKINIQGLKKKKKNFTKYSGNEVIRKTSKKYREAKEKYNKRKAQLKKEAAEEYKGVKTYRFSRQGKLNSQMERIIQKALNKRLFTNEELKEMLNINKKDLYEQAINKLKSRYLGISRFSPSLQLNIRNISKRQRKINVADEYIAKQEGKNKKEKAAADAAVREAPATGEPGAVSSRASALGTVAREGPGVRASAPARAANARAAKAREGPGARVETGAAEARAAKAEVEARVAAAEATAEAERAKAAAAEERAEAERARANKAEAELKSLKEELARLRASRQERGLTIVETNV